MRVHVENTTTDSIDRTEHSGGRRETVVCGKIERRYVRSKVSRQMEGTFETPTGKIGRSEGN